MSTVSGSIRRGLQQAVAYAEGTADGNAYRVHVPAQIDVKAIRVKLEMTQEEFSGRFGFPAIPCGIGNKVRASRKVPRGLICP